MTAAHLSNDNSKTKGVSTLNQAYLRSIFSKHRQRRWSSNHSYREMPGGKNKKPTCDLCCDSLEKQHEILTCEGDCGCIVHRYCAGVTKRHYEDLTKGSSPFVCQWCSLKTSHAIIQQLQSEVAALKLELVEAKASITKQSQALYLVSQAEKKDLRLSCNTTT